MTNKLELTWYGKDEPIKVEPRLLIENPELSNTYLDPETENMLIHGDNLLALKALEQDYAGQVKCVYIDPPYNAGEAYEHYDDNLEHSQWLNLMRPRLEIMRNLLSEDGTIWISIDDDEQAYLKVLCDEIFGRGNYIETIVWQRAYSPVNLKKTISRSHDYILVYAKKMTKDYSLNKLPRTAEANERYKNPDNDPRGVWKSTDSTAQAGHGTQSQFYVLKAPNGKEHHLTPGRCWVYTEDVMNSMIADNRVWFGEDGNNVPALKRFLSEVRDGIVPQTLWTYPEVGHTQEAKKEIKTFGYDTVFRTPKPERLIERVLTIASNPGDIILDSFLGSGTTAAVAHKMRRRYIGIELGDHAYTYCKTRLDRIISGEDNIGITEKVDWHGGGGYRFYELAPSLIEKDAFGEDVINSEYDADMLAAAVALHEGFEYQPDKTLFWKQSKGTENSFLFVTTRHISLAYLNSIKETMEDDEFLVIACKSYDREAEKAFDRIVLKKIPQMLLGRCEFGMEDYNLNIVHPPVYDEDCWEGCDEE